MKKKIIRITSCFLSLILIFSLCCSASYNTNTQTNSYILSNEAIAPYVAPNTLVPSVNSTSPTSGIFFIKQRTLGLYLKALDYFSPVAESFSGYQEQTWELIQDGTSEYFKIKNCENGRYITAPSKNSGITTGLIDFQDENTINPNYQLWSFSLQSNGAFYIVPKLNSNYILSITDTLGTYGYGIQLKSKPSNFSPKSSWFLQGIPYSYTHYYDVTLQTSPTHFGEIYNANSFAQLVYLSNFGIELQYTVPTLYTNFSANSCSHGINEPCDNSCGTDCSVNHHKNGWVISNQLYNSSLEDNNQIIVMWTNRDTHTYCNKTNNNHSTVSWLAVVYNSRPVIHFMHINDAGTNGPLATMAITLAHETAHTFGLDDVYDINGHDIDFGYHCIMEYEERNHSYQFYQQVMAGEISPFCDSCTSALKEAIKNDIINDYS